MTGSRLGRTALAVLALGLFAFEAVAFISVARTARQLDRGGTASAMDAGGAAVRILSEVVARGVARTATGVAGKLAARAMRVMAAPVQLTAKAPASGRHVHPRSVVVVRAARCTHSVTGCRRHRRLVGATPA